MPEAAAAWAAEALVSAGVSAATAAAISTFAVNGAINFAVSTVIGKVFGPSGSSGGAMAPQQINTTVRQSAAPRRLIYGESKTGGLLVYPAQPINGDCHLAIYLGEGPIESVDPVFWLAEDLSTDAKFAGLLQLVPYLGAPGQAASAELIAASGGEWTADHVGTGCAWAHARLKFNRNAFPQGLIFPSFMVRGRKIFDPRTGLTVWSSNPALCTLDFIRSEYGYAAPDSWIDFASFAAAASVDDEILESVDPDNIVNGVPGRVRRYSCNGVFEVGSNPASIVASIEACSGGRLVFTGGKYRMYSGAWRAPTGPTLTDEFLRGAPTYRTHPGRQQRMNIARGTYREPKQDWQETDFQEQSLPAAIVAEDGEIVQAARLPAVTIGAQAQRLARQQMMLARSAVPLVLQCNYAAFVWRLYDTVPVSLPEVGAVGTFLITDYSFPEGGGIDMSLVPHRAEDFAWTPALHERLVPEVIRPDFNSTPPVVTGLVVSGEGVDVGEGGLRSGITAVWDTTADVFMDHYDVQIKSTLDADWASVLESGAPAIARYSSTSALVVGEEYDFRVRVVRGNGTYGPWVGEDGTLIDGDETPPDPPTALSVTGTGLLTIHWTTPGGRDFRRSNVYVNSSMSAFGATLLTSITGNRLTPMTTTHAPGATRYYYVSAQDATGNESALTYAGSGT